MYENVFAILPACFQLFVMLTLAEAIPEAPGLSQCFLLMRGACNRHDHKECLMKGSA